MEKFGPIALRAVFSGVIARNASLAARSYLGPRVAVVEFWLGGGCGMPLQRCRTGRAPSRSSPEGRASRSRYTPIHPRTQTTRVVSDSGVTTVPTTGHASSHVAKHDHRNIPEGPRTLMDVAIVHPNISMQTPTGFWGEELRSFYESDPGQLPAVERSAS